MSDGQAGNIGIGFAMPINRAKVVLEEYRVSGRIRLPELGLRTQLIQGDIAEALNLPTEGGLLVQQVNRGSSAADAGVRGPTKRVIVGNTYALLIGGDFIVAVDGKAVESQDAIARAMTRKRVGDPLELTVWRDGRKQKITVKLAEAGGGGSTVL
jgi:S1-C subfamily serine protease